MSVCVLCLGQESPSQGAIIAAIILIGFFLGPMQPIAIESAAECTYPSSEGHFTAVLQLVANVFSTALVPAMAALQVPGRGILKNIWTVH